jgi:hypothetical protein
MEGDDVILSDPDEEFKPFGSRLKKHKIELCSEDEYEQPSVKRMKKIKTTDTKCAVSEKKKNRTAPTERKLKLTVKRTVNKTNVVKEENKNEVLIYFSMRKLNVYIKCGNDYFFHGLCNSLFINHLII